MISGSNINLDFLYLVNKKDLKGILETGIIKKSKKDSNYNDKVFLMSNTAISKNTENIKVLILKNLKSNKLCDSPIKIWNLIKRGETDINSNYKLYGISIKNYLYRRYSAKKKKNEIKENSNVINANKVAENTSNLDKIIEVIVEGIIEERKNQIFLPYTVDEIDDYMRCYPRSYVTASDVVKKEFTINFTTLFKHPYRARFEEAYNLMKNRENKGIVSSLMSAFRISLKRKLNPAVIAACKSKRELKKYLICLKRNELENFKTFNTIYELASV